MKTRLALLVVLVAIVGIWPANQRATGQAAGSPKGPKPALEKVVAELRQLEANHKLRVEKGAATGHEDEPFRALNRARYLAGEIPRAEFLQRSEELTEIQRKNLAGLRAIGAAGDNEALALANAVLLDYALRPVE